MYSIIVPIYKVEPYLVQCIESVLAQTHKDFELILVDDGSPDRCPQICDEYAKKDSRVKVVHKENGGLVSARKAGLAAATGAYICFVDGDDFIAEDMLAVYEAVLQNQEVDMICAGCSSCCGDTITPMKQSIPEGLYDKAALQEVVYPQMLSKEPFHTFFVFPSVALKCFKKELLEKIYPAVPNEMALGEDTAVTYPALRLANTVYVVEHYGYRYRVNQDSMTHAYDKKLYNKIRNLLCYLRKLEGTPVEICEKQLDKYTVYLLYLARNNELNYNTEASYAAKKKNLNIYLQDEIFSRAVKNVKMRSLKDKMVLFCFKHRLIYPLFLYGKMRK